MIGRDDERVDAEACRELTPLDIACYARWAAITRVALLRPDPRHPYLEVAGTPLEAHTAYQLRHQRAHLRDQQGA